MAKDIDLAIRLAMEAAEAVDGFTDIDAAAADMSETVQDAADVATSAAEDMGSIGDAASEMTSQAALAGGAMRGLSAGLDAVGLTGAADTLQQVGAYTKAAVGVGKSLNLVMRNQAVVTKASAAAQWVLNAAMSANPIGAVVALVALLVGGFILAYKKSETFRAVVDTAMRGAKAAIGWVVDRVQDVIDLVKEKLNPIWPTVSTAIGVAKDLIVGYFTLITTPIRTLIDLVKDLIDWISKIDFPSPPDWVSDLFRTSDGSRRAGGFGGSTTIVNVAALLDPRQAQQLLFRQQLTFGVPVAG